MLGMRRVYNGPGGLRSSGRQRFDQSDAEIAGGAREGHTLRCVDPAAYVQAVVAALPPRGIDRSTPRGSSDFRLPATMLASSPITSRTSSSIAAGISILINWTANWQACCAAHWTSVAPRHSPT